jgi:hypothetical protein
MPRSATANSHIAALVMSSCPFKPAKYNQNTAFHAHDKRELSNSKNEKAVYAYEHKVKFREIVEGVGLVLYPVSEYASLALSDLLVQFNLNKKQAIDKKSFSHLPVVFFNEFLFCFVLFSLCSEKQLKKYHASGTKLFENIDYVKIEQETILKSLTLISQELSMKKSKLIFLIKLIHLLCIYNQRKKNRILVEEIIIISLIKIDNFTLKNTKNVLQKNVYMLRHKIILKIIFYLK